MRMRGFAMDSFEWMELQTLTSEIATSRSRLSTVRSSKDHRLARGLEKEITAAEARRRRLLAQLTSDLAGATERAPHPEAIEGAEFGPALAPVEETLRHDAEGSHQSLEFADRIAGSGAASPASAPNADSVEGVIIMWDKLTPSDIERATQELGVRRNDMLARHAAALNELDADQAQLETLEQAIDAFVRKFNRSSPEGAIVTLGEERELRQQARG
jgi:hypothetical protein